MKLKDLYPSKYLRAADLEGEDRLLTISAVQEETVGQGDQAASKAVLYFEEETTGLVLNKTNATTIGDLYGDDTDAWLGRKVVLYPTEVNFAGEMVEAIRVRGRKWMEQRAARARKPKAAVEEPPPPTAEWEMAGPPETPFD